MKNIMHIIILLNLAIHFEAIASDYQKTYQGLVDNSESLYSFARTLQKEYNLWRSIPNDQFPTENNRMKRIVERSGSDKQDDTKKQIVKDAQSVKLLIHPKVKTALEDFLVFKREKGTFGEKKLYKEMTLEQFVYRLIYNRPLVFSNEWDSIMLRPENSMINSKENIQALGEKAIFTQSDYRGTEFIFEAKQYYKRLVDYLSYDEIPFAAMLGLSSPTYFINNGGRMNRGNLGDPGSYEERGVYVGLVGPRLEKRNYMEWQQMVITQEQNTPQENKYGHRYGQGNNSDLMKIWSTLYDGIEFLTYDEVQQEVLKGNSRFTRVQKNGTQLTNAFFDITAYKKRMSIIIESFLLEANNSALQLGTQADVFVVGLGLGVWEFDDRQVLWMMQVYQDLINTLELPDISRINFSCITYTRPPKIENPKFRIQDADFILNGITKNKHIEIVFTDDNPANPMPADKKNHLRFAMYAWDGNAYAGNEYWTGSLAASGDPAAACCSTIPEIQNPLINRFIKENIKTDLEQVKAKEQQKKPNFMVQQAAAQKAIGQTQQPPTHQMHQKQTPQPVLPTPPQSTPQQQTPKSPQLARVNQDKAQTPAPAKFTPKATAFGKGKKFTKTPNPTATPPSGPSIWEQLSSFVSSISSGASAAMSGIWNGILWLFGRSK